MAALLPSLDRGTKCGAAHAAPWGPLARVRVAASVALLPSLDRGTKCGAAHAAPRRHLQVICCSGARSTITADLARVDDVGVANLAKAFMDELVGCGGCEENGEPTLGAG